MVMEERRFGRGGRLPQRMEKQWNSPKNRMMVM